MAHFPAVQFTAPFRVYVPEEFFQVTMGDAIYHVQAVPVDAASMTGFERMEEPDVEVAHDIFGFAGRTRFVVMIECPFSIKEPNWKEAFIALENQLIEGSVEAVNRFLRVYREHDRNTNGQQSFHVVELVGSDLRDLLLYLVDHKGRKETDLSVSFPGHRDMALQSATERPESVTEAIREQLSTGDEIPIESEFLTSAENHLWRGLCRLAPVEANTAVEIVIHAALQRAAPSKTISDKATLLDKARTLDDALARKVTATGRNFTPWFDPDIQGWRAIQSSELQVWYTDCYELRNRVIHQGYNDVSRPEARAAISSARNLMAMIESDLSLLHY